MRTGITYWRYHLSHGTREGAAYQEQPTRSISPSESVDHRFEVRKSSCSRSTCPLCVVLTTNTRFRFEP